MTTPQLVVLLLRVALAAVFVVAAIGKLRDVVSAAKAAHELGVPQRLAPIVGRSLPGVELTIAAGLLVTPAARWAAIAAAALLVVFSVAVAVQLARGRRPSCNCFGGGDSPIGVGTLVRNSVLAASSATVLASGFAGATTCSVGCPSTMSSGQAVGTGVAVVGAVVLGVHTVLLVNLLRQRGELLDRIDALETAVAERPVPKNRLADAAARHRHTRSGPPLGKPAPSFALADLDGRVRPSHDLLLGDRPTVLVFLETSCSACVAVSAEIGERAARGEGPDDRRLVAVVSGGAAEVATVIDRRGYSAVLHDPDGSVALDYGVSGTPSAITVLSDGRVASAIFAGRAQVTRVIRPRPEQLASTTNVAQISHTPGAEVAIP